MEEVRPLTRRRNVGFCTVRSSSAISVQELSAQPVLACARLAAIDRAVRGARVLTKESDYEYYNNYEDSYGVHRAGGRGLNPPAW